MNDDRTGEKNRLSDLEKEIKNMDIDKFLEFENHLKDVSVYMGGGAT